MRKERSLKVNILMYIAMILLCVTLFSMCLVSNMYARYTESIESSDSARIAQFSITQEGELFKNLKAEAAPGTTHGATLIIKNDSEVAVEYTLTVTNKTGNLPLKFKLGPVDANTPTVKTEEHKNGISISSARQIPGQHTDKYTLDIIWEQTGDNSEENLALIGMVDYITISVEATQID